MIEVKLPNEIKDAEENSLFPFLAKNMDDGSIWLISEYTAPDECAYNGTCIYSGNTETIGVFVEGISGFKLSVYEGPVILRNKR